MEVYFDNAATSFPKPDIVHDKMFKYLKNNGASAGRGAYKRAFQADQTVFNTRDSLSQLFNIADPTRIVFTHNITEAINLALKGLLEENDHVITTSLEHNAVWRPLKELERDRGIEITKIESQKNGQISTAKIEDAVKENTKLIVCLHASNVTGNILPIKEIGEIAADNNLHFLVDTAQTAGLYPIDVQEMKIDLLAFTGHKGLLGPTGTGGLYIKEGVEMKPLKTGGTGNNSTSEYPPEGLPNRYEAGTINTVGLIGLGAGVDYILDLGIEEIRKKELELIEYTLKSLERIEDIIIYGEQDPQNKVGVISFNLKDLDHAAVAHQLDNNYNIMVRSGMHCAPNVHKSIGSFDLGGAVRIGLGYFNNKKEVDYLINALQKIN